MMLIVEGIKMDEQMDMYSSNMSTADIGGRRYAFQIMKNNLNAKYKSQNYLYFYINIPFSDREDAITTSFEGQLHWYRRHDY